MKSKPEKIKKYRLTTKQKQAIFDDAADYARREPMRRELDGILNQMSDLESLIFLQKALLDMAKRAERLLSAKVDHAKANRLD